MALHRTKLCRQPRIRELVRLHRAWNKSNIDPKLVPKPTSVAKIKVGYRKPVPKTRVPHVKQPTNAFPKYYFTFVMQRPDGVTISWSAAAFNKELAIQQATGLSQQFSWKFIKVIQGRQMDWSAFKVPWRELAAK